MGIFRPLDKDLPFISCESIGNLVYILAIANRLNAIKVNDLDSNYGQKISETED